MARDAEAVGAATAALQAALDDDATALQRVYTLIDETVTALSASAALTSSASTHHHHKPATSSPTIPPSAASASSSTAPGASVIDRQLRSIRGRLDVLSMRCGGLSDDLQAGVEAAQALLRSVQGAAMVSGGAGRGDASVASIDDGGAAAKTGSGGNIGGGGVPASAVVNNNYAPQSPLRSSPTDGPSSSSTSRGGGSGGEAGGYSGSNRDYSSSSDRGTRGVVISGSGVYTAPTKLGGGGGAASSSFPPSAGATAAPDDVSAAAARRSQNPLPALPTNRRGVSSSGPAVARSRQAVDGVGGGEGDGGEDHTSTLWRLQAASVMLDRSVERRDELLQQDYQQQQQQVQNQRQQQQQQQQHTAVAYDSSPASIVSEEFSRFREQLQWELASEKQQTRQQKQQPEPYPRLQPEHEQPQNQSLSQPQQGQGQSQSQHWPQSITAPRYNYSITAPRYAAPSTSAPHTATATAISSYTDVDAAAGAAVLDGWLHDSLSASLAAVGWSLEQPQAREYAHTTPSAAAAVRPSQSRPPSVPSPSPANSSPVEDAAPSPPQQQRHRQRQYEQGQAEGDDGTERQQRAFISPPSAAGAVRPTSGSGGAAYGSHRLPLPTPSPLGAAILEVSAESSIAPYRSHGGDFHNSSIGNGSSISRLLRSGGGGGDGGDDYTYSDGGGAGGGEGRFSALGMTGRQLYTDDVASPMTVRTSAHGSSSSSSSTTTSEVVQQPYHGSSSPGAAAATLTAIRGVVTGGGGAAVPSPLNDRRLQSQSQQQQQREWLQGLSLQRLAALEEEVFSP